MLAPSVPEIELARNAFAHVDVPIITIFGSARTQRGAPLYDHVRHLANFLGKRGYAILTGGGPGSMEAANQGCQEAGRTPSLACGLKLFGEPANDYADERLTFEHLYARKVALVAHSAGFVFTPGGFGTLDETFEVLTLLQTGKMPARNIVFFDRAFWAPVLRPAFRTMVEWGFVASRDTRVPVVSVYEPQLVEYYLARVPPYSGISGQAYPALPEL